MFVFIDESGNFKGKKNGCFIVGGFVTGNPDRTAKLFRKWQHRKFNNLKLRYRPEVKFSDTRLSEELRLKTVEHFVSQDIRLFYTFLNIKNIPPQYRQKKKLKSGLLYAEIVTHTLVLLLPSSELSFRIFRDKRQLKNLSEKQFNEIIRMSLLPDLPAKGVLQIEALDSAASPNIQIADWVCGALFRYYNRGLNGDRYFSILKNNIIVSKELFEDYWYHQVANKNKKPPRKR